MECKHSRSNGCTLKEFTVPDINTGMKLQTFWLQKKMLSSFKWNAKNKICDLDETLYLLRKPLAGITIPQVMSKCFFGCKSSTHEDDIICCPWIHLPWMSFRLWKLSLIEWLDHILVNLDADSFQRLRKSLRSTMRDIMVLDTEVWRTVQ